ncbi:hypothetical protein ACIRBX_00385 [Kitasatospora sp. NPDC096147]|uniref:hypothetical protein n=1 Tax=Kitasatospora sp. NPDC096147 TaxID=3364093 RepID=UPI003816242C
MKPLRHLLTATATGAFLLAAALPAAATTTATFSGTSGGRANSGQAVQSAYVAAYNSAAVAGYPRSRCTAGGVSWVSGNAVDGWAAGVTVVCTA